MDAFLTQTVIDAFFDKVSDTEDIPHFVMTWECYCLLFFVRFMMFPLS